jgi:flavin-dependent dehydrogenase
MHDVAIIGGGPGGSTAANLLALAGHDVVLFERERFPRFHIGESLLPHNMRIFERLGIVDTMKQRFMEKWGVEFISSDGELTRLFHFEEAIDRRYPMCFQVPRSEFDRLLLDQAASRGARVHEGTAVKDAQQRPDGCWCLVLQDGNRQPRTVECRFLVDASGRDGLLARQRGLRDMHPGHRRAAVFAHFRNVPRRAGRDAGNIVIVMMRDGWFWLIPFADGKTSVGVVAEGKNIQEQRLSIEALLGLAIDRCPAVRRLMEKAERVSQVYATSDWTYRSRRIVGDGYLLVGDAAAFIDPVFSTGVLLAMSSAEMAADLLDEGLRQGELSERRLRDYERAVSEHVQGYWRIVETFYSSSFPRLCFYPETRLGIPAAVLTLLAGNMDPAWSVRWRLRLFYSIASIYRRFNLGPRVRLHAVFEEGMPAA